MGRFSPIASPEPPATALASMSEPRNDDTIVLTRLKAAIGRHLPWWLVVAIGAGCVVLGGVRIADPCRSPPSTCS
jgi:hypothetical protein